MPRYQLTKYKSGSIAEVWYMSWPLILSMFSVTLMIYVDRIILARFSHNCLNAVSRAAMASYVFIMGPMTIASITEVLCGKYHGSNMLSKMGPVVWQTIWISLFSVPLFILVSKLGSLFFFTSPLEKIYENQYFSTITCYGFIFLLPISFGGFFASQGKVHLVTLVVFSGSIINVLLDYILIYGIWKIPSLGIKGAALGTVLAQVAQVIIFFIIFLSSSYKEKCNTWRFNFDKMIISDLLRIGSFLSIARILENFGFFIFLTFMHTAGAIHITIASVMQSIFSLLSCYIEGLSKGLASIISNFLGANKIHLILRTIKSACKFHILSFVVVVVVVILFSSQVIVLFKLDNIFKTNNNSFLFKQTLFWLLCFFLFEGFGWIFKSLYISLGKTKLILFLSFFSQWLFVLLPTYINLKLSNMTAINPWQFVALGSIITFFIYLFIYFKWKRNVEQLTS